MDTLITLDNIIFSYPAEESEPVRVLDGISLTVGEGEFLAVVGHNGSGKSTMAKLFNAVLIPDEGTVTVGGLKTSDGNDDEKVLLKIRQTVGMVFQNPDNQLVATLVEEDVAFALENLGVPPPEIRRRVDEALETVGMTEYALHAPHKLSGGQKQRVAIAGIIAMRPRCIVLDEPTAMLDPSGRSEVMETIRGLNRDYGITIILITHHMNEAAGCDRVVVMSDGHIEMDAPPREVFSRYDRLKELGLFVPQQVELAHSLGIKGDPPLTVGECAERVYEWLSLAVDE